MSTKQTNVAYTKITSTIITWQIVTFIAASAKENEDQTRPDQTKPNRQAWVFTRKETMLLGYDDNTNHNVNLQAFFIVK